MEQNFYKVIDKTFNSLKTPCIICDLDGTLCNDEHRKPAVTGDGWGEKEYNEYFSKIHNDTPYQHIKEIVTRFSQDHKIIFLTGRPAKYTETTTNWIKEHTGLEEFKLIMRGHDDYRCDTVVKTELYNQNIKPHHDVLFVLEDRTKVVKMWRELGLPCLQVQQSDY